MKSELRRLLGRVLHHNKWFRNIVYLPLDFVEGIFGLRDELVPPRRIRNISGRGPFEKIGLEFLGHFIKYGGLKPGDHVLDVGCGAGRIALALTGYLNETGSYEGFDIISELIEWCENNITPKYPNFHFQLADVFNQLYNQKGGFHGTVYKFPYPDQSFDFVFLTSVFTHLLPEDLANYTSEISRVLKKDGRCLITFFLLNEQSLRQIAEGKSTQDFRHPKDGYRIVDEKSPEQNVAYDEKFIRGLYQKNGLQIVEPIHYGLWCGRSEFLSYQDIIVAQKM